MALLPRKITELTLADPVAGAVVPGVQGGANVGLPADKLGPPPLGLWDWWYEGRLMNIGLSSLDGFAGSGLNGGSNSTTIPAEGQAGFNSHGVYLRSGSVTVNSGYRYMTSSVVADYFGTISHKFRSQFMWTDALDDRTVRAGYLDTTTMNDATDGAYFEIVDGQCVGKTADDGTRTSTPAITLAVHTPYTFDIEVNAAGTSARFRVFEGTSLTPLVDETLTTNIPTTQARAFGAGIVATAATASTNIGVLYSLGIGTVAGFNRARGIA